MTKKLKCVQIGVGGFGRHWCSEVLPWLAKKELAEVVAVADINQEALINAKSQLALSDEQLYTDAEKAISDTRPDFVAIVVPPALHEKMVDLALKYDCHIISEKPIADSMNSCCRIYKKVKNAGKKMAITMSHRFDQDKQTLEREIKSQKHGNLNYIIGRFTCNCRKLGSWGDFRYKIPYPLLIEGTVHHFDIYRALSGSNAKTVYTTSWNPQWSEFEGDSNALIVMEMENGVKCFYEGAKANASTLNGWTNEYFRAECEHGTLEIDKRKLQFLSNNCGAKPIAKELPLDKQDVWKNPWLAELFCKWLNGGPIPANSLDDNINCAALLFAAIESAKTKQIINVKDFLEAHMQNCF